MKNFTLNIQSGRFYLFFPYNPEVVSRVRAIPSARWNEPFKVWTFPLTRVSYDNIVAVTGERNADIETYLSKLRGATINLRHYQFKTQPMQHQLEAVAFLLSKFGLTVKI